MDPFSFLLEAGSVRSNCVMGNRDSPQEGSGFSDHWRQDMLSAFIFLGTRHRADLQRLLVENNIQKKKKKKENNIQEP